MRSTTSRCILYFANRSKNAAEYLALIPGKTRAYINTIASTIGKLSPAGQTSAAAKRVTNPPSTEWTSGIIPKRCRISESSCAPRGWPHAPAAAEDIYNFEERPLQVGCILNTFILAPVVKDRFAASRNG